MSTSRRAFLQSMSAGACLVGVMATAEGDTSPANLPWDRDGLRPVTPDKAKRGLRILILGGTGLLGPHIVNYATARGHTITLFNRGRTNPHLFPDVEKLRGDRHDDIEALRGHEWDVVIDTTAYVPRHVTATATLLADHVDHYILTSSLSVYADHSVIGATEDSPVTVLDDAVLEEVRSIRESLAHYSGMKAHCEKAAEAVMPGRVTNIRPGLISGPRDPSGRFTYWPARMDRGGEVLAPSDGSDPIQLIDVRDLAEWVVHVAEERIIGVFNAVGPATHAMNMHELLYGVRAVTDSDAKLTWVDTDFVLEHGLAGWTDLPVWIPPRDGYEGFHTVRVDRAVAAGLTTRPLATTAADTLAWFKSLSPEGQQRAGGVLTEEREAAVLKAWHARAVESAEAAVPTS
jgi:2'-hydroxyisoflavone reductase